MQECNRPVGCDGTRRRQMNKIAVALAAPKAVVSSTTMAVIMVAGLGLGMVTLAGHVQAQTLHDAAHDVRHATGFPCH